MKWNKSKKEFYSLFLVFHLTRVMHRDTLISKIRKETSFLSFIFAVHSDKRASFEKPNKEKLHSFINNLL